MGQVPQRPQHDHSPDRLKPTKLHPRHYVSAIQPYLCSVFVAEFGACFSPSPRACYRSLCILACFAMAKKARQRISYGELTVVPSLTPSTSLTRPHPPPRGTPQLKNMASRTRRQRMAPHACDSRQLILSSRDMCAETTSKASLTRRAPSPRERQSLRRRSSSGRQWPGRGLEQ